MKFKVGDIVISTRHNIFEIIEIISEENIYTKKIDEYYLVKNLINNAQYHVPKKDAEKRYKTFGRAGAKILYGTKNLLSKK